MNPKPSFTKAQIVQPAIPTTAVPGKVKPLIVTKKVKDQYSFVTPRFSQIFDRLLQASSFHPQEFAATLPAEILPIFQNIYLAASTLNLDSHVLHYDIQKTLRHLITLGLKGRLSELSQKIPELETLGQDDKLKILETEYNQLLGRLADLQTDKS